MVKGKDDKDDCDTTVPYLKRSEEEVDDQPEILIETDNQPPAQEVGPGVLILVVIPNRSDGMGHIGVPEKINLTTRVPDAYHVLHDILKERRQGITSALVSNFKRNKSWGRGIFAGLCTFVGGLVSVALIGEPYSGFAVGAAIGAAGPVVVDTNQIRRTKLTSLRTEYPDTPEFRDAWAVCCYEAMVIVRGFNARIDAIERLIKMSGKVSPERAEAMLQTAAEMSEMLYAVRDELITLCEILAQYQPDDVETIIAPPEYSATVKHIDPLKGGKFDWLILDPEIIPIGHEREQLERDRREAEAFAKSLREVADELDPFEALRRRQEQGEDPSDR